MSLDHEDALTEAGEDGSLTLSQELGSLASVLAAIARTESISLAPGTLLAEQYRIERRLGEGGMGVVFLARDLRLDRDVAVKLCTGLSRAAVRRIRREAVALAKLAHPNVVVVFQAGEIDARFFLVMEYVAGGTARSWVGQGRRPRDILALYLDAGAGLAAAHAAGLVHCDFKPDNVLVGVDGRARVADFGLVRVGDRDRSLGASSGGASTTDSLVTQPGAVMGTLAYMPPEQLAGAPIDARADQYSFAASLWEALMGWRPTIEGRRGEGGRGGSDEAELAADVPRHVVVALRRALAERASDRWPDLDALLAELRRDPIARRRRFALGFVALGLSAGLSGVVVGSMRDEAPAVCEDGPAKLDAVWGPERRAAIEALLDPVLDPVAWPAIADRLDARAAAWIDAYTQACRATQIEGAADEATLHRRMLCLDARRDELDATIVALASGSRIVLANAAESIDLLPASSACLADELDSEPTPPSDPELRVEIARARRAIVDAETTVLDPSLLDGQVEAERALDLATATEWPPVIAEALIARAAIAFEFDRDEAAIADYENATRLALGAGADGLAMRAMIGSAWPLASLGRTSEATLLLNTARGLWERVGRSRADERLLLGAEAHVAIHEHRAHDALAKTREQIAVSEAEGELPITRIATNQYNLGIALEQAGEFEQAMQAATRAIALAREALGDEHPTVARYRSLAAKIAARRGELDRAIELATAALESIERWFGPEDTRLAVPLDVLANAAQRQGRHADAAAFYGRHLELRIRHTPDSPTIPKLEANLAIVAVGQGDLAGAELMATRALRSLERLYGLDYPDLVQVLVLTGYLARERPEPDFAGSERDLLRALAIAEAKLGPDHTKTINVEIELANTEVAAGKPELAVERLERILTRLDEIELPLAQPGELRFSLARAHMASGDEARACTLAEAAELGLRGLEVDAAPMAEWRSQNCGVP
ncbi:protein kinase domain-containing protein [Nannocystaceae bacterium ST9]